MYQDNIQEHVNKPIRSKQLALNVNKEGTVREINGKVYVDFLYLGRRVRESSGLPWSQQNAKLVRDQLDRIMLSIHDGTFVFRKVFPKSKKVDFFSELERKISGRSLSPDELVFQRFAWEWYDLLKTTGRVTARTLLDYKRQLELYIIPFFGELRFSQISPAMVEEFNAWAKQQQFRDKIVSNKTLNKCLIPVRMICKQAALRFNWGSTFNPFFGYKNLPEDSTTYKIEPFTIDEQQRIIHTLPDHWKPYFQFAFGSGIRQGEQFALKPDDIDWASGHISISRAMTLDEQGHRMEGRTKNKYSRREIQLLPAMKAVLLDQKAICERLNSEYLFCTTAGNQLNHANLSNRTWRPALEMAKIPFRPMIQTRHSFATTALTLGENPLWIAHVMGHRDTDMIIRVYAKFVKSAANHDGKAMNDIHNRMISNNK
ncbi:MAG: site-specific integrase [Desulfobulbaceae bacterium]|nr:MAG: site-specific integrase [Desulfobulbaceae bacterium]